MVLADPLGLYDLYLPGSMRKLPSSMLELWGSTRKKLRRTPPDMGRAQPNTWAESSYSWTLSYRPTDYQSRRTWSEPRMVACLFCRQCAPCRYLLMEELSKNHMVIKHKVLWTLDIWASDATRWAYITRNAGLRGVRRLSW